MAIKNMCRGSGYPVGGRMGASNRGRLNECPVCGRKVGQRSGRDGKLFSHAYKPEPKENDLSETLAEYRDMSRHCLGAAEQKAADAWVLCQLYVRNTP